MPQHTDIQDGLCMCISQAEGRTLCQERALQGPAPVKGVHHLKFVPSCSKIRHSCQEESSWHHTVSFIRAGSGMQGGYSRAPMQTMLHRHQACRRSQMTRTRRYSC